MAYTFSHSNISENQIVFVYEDCAFSGVRKIAGKVREDIAKVFGAKPIGIEYADFKDTANFFEYPVFFGTVGKSEILDKLAANGSVDLFNIAKEEEVYSLSVIDGLEFDGFTFESAIVIAGSDKRGTIYGLFRLSEMIGISPLSGWLDATPQKLSTLAFTKEDSFTSKKPSVRYRGFFINDEWPAFGNFCNKNFGGFNARAYEHVFELLLRLKGNYLWPAMWSTVFGDDGPGLKSCELADELGVIMGTSHHESCMRQGEEYSHVRGPGSEYGDAWDFRANREGIIKFWKDGIDRRKDFENIYTVGMRGEADTPISGDTSLADNIELLRDVIKTQNGLLADGLRKDINDIPRLLVLYKEVEPIFYGDEKTQGLEKDPVLDGITLMLCDDNYGNLRSVPKDECRDRAGGWGMYYHMDYHGLPVSYEWFNTNYLPKIWEQMTSAYDFGIREAWIVNVGDIFTNEYPLSFFLELAYDFDRWGTDNKNSAKEFTKHFVGQNFAGLSKDKQEDIEKLLLGYTKITSRRRTEAMNDEVYTPFMYGECETLIKETDELMKKARELYRLMPRDIEPLFYEIVYVPLMGNLNVQQMWALTTMNHAYAKMGSTLANSLADEIRSCLKSDRKLIDKLHTTLKGKWYGMGLSEHIGFTNWCEEECRNPVVHTIEPADKPRLIALIPETGEHTEGGFWSGKTLTLTSCLDPLVCGGYIELSTASEEKVSYSISCESEFIDIMDPGKSVKCGRSRSIFIFADRMKMKDKTYDCARIVITYDGGIINIDVPVNNPVFSQDIGEKTFMMFDGVAPEHTRYISIPAAAFFEKSDSERGSFEVIEGLGRAHDAVKAYPQNIVFTGKDAPSVSYSVFVPEEGEYNLRVYTTPANPSHSGENILFTLSANGSVPEEIGMIPEGFEVRDRNALWERGVLDNVRTKDVFIRLKKGLNKITIGAMTPGFVLEKIVITPKDVTLPYSYLGPQESYHS